MLYLVICRDKPDSEQARKDLMQAHKPYIAPFLDRFLVGGFMRDAVGAQVGSMVVIEANSEAEARAVFTADPYNGAVWSEIGVSLFEPMAGRWVGGPQW